MHLFIALLSGLIFGLGVIVSGMIQPSKVLGFLDLAGNWDPSLALVMAGAIIVAMPAFMWARRQSTSCLNLPMQLPPPKRVDQRLIMGSLMFGAGWGIAGFCPAPAVVALSTGHTDALIFILSMLAGFMLFHFLEVHASST